MSLSIGPATDYLVTKATSAVNGVVVGGKPVLVVDGSPAELVPGMFVVGLSDPPPNEAAASDGLREPATQETSASFDDYAVPCYIDIRVAGTVQKTARDIACSIFDAFAAVIDRNLGGALVNGYAEITNLRITPSNVGTVGEPGRRQFISFDVRCVSVTG